MDEETTLLTESNVDMLKEWQKKSAVGHWSVIRTVVPGRVWENYQVVLGTQKGLRYVEGAGKFYGNWIPCQGVEI